MQGVRAWEDLFRLLLLSPDLSDLIPVGVDQSKSGDVGAAVLEVLQADHVKILQHVVEIPMLYYRMRTTDTSKIINKMLHGQSE